MRPRPHCILLLALLIPAACSNPGSSSSYVRVGEGGSIVSRAGDGMEVRWRQDGIDTIVDVEGELVLTEDEREVASFVKDGSLRVRTRGDGPRRDMLVESSSDGLVRRYAIDGEDAPWDLEAQDWFARVLDELVQRTGVGAPARAERILAEGGPMALALEIGRIDPGAAQNIYVERLLEEPRLEKGVLLVALDATPRMSSETARAFLASRCAPHDPGDAELTARLLDVANNLGSSSKRLELLETLAVQRQFDASTAERALRVAGNISTESSRSEALVALLPVTVGAGPEAAWVTAARSIANSSLRSSALQTFLQRETITPRGLLAVIGAAETISSESARAATLEAWLVRAPADPKQRARWIEAVATISNSSMKGELLAALIERDELAPETYALAADAVAEISGESARSEVLVLLAQRAPLSAQGRVLDAIDTISNSSLRAAPLIQLLEREALDKATLDQAAEVIGRISSDSTRAEVQELLIEKLAGSN